MPNSKQDQSVFPPPSIQEGHKITSDGGNPLVEKYRYGRKSRRKYQSDRKSQISRSRNRHLATLLLEATGKFFLLARPHDLDVFVRAMLGLNCRQTVTCRGSIIMHT